jgi:hypothetical protein
VAEQHQAVGPFAVSPSLARYRAVPQVEMELG